MGVKRKPVLSNFLFSSHTRPQPDDVYLHRTLRSFWAASVFVFIPPGAPSHGLAFRLVSRRTRTKEVDFRSSPFANRLTGSGAGRIRTERCGDFCEGVNPSVNPVQFEMPGLSESGQQWLIFSLLHLFTPGASRYQPFPFPLALSANNEKILVPLLHSLSIRFIPSPSARTCERTQSVPPCSLPCNLGQ